MLECMFDTYIHLYVYFPLLVFGFFFTQSFFIHVIALDSCSLSTHREGKGSLHPLTKMDFKILIFTISLYSAVCILKWCQREKHYKWKHPE